MSKSNSKVPDERIGIRDFALGFPLLLGLVVLPIVLFISSFFLSGLGALIALSNTADLLELQDYERVTANVVVLERQVDCEGGNFCKARCKYKLTYELEGRTLTYEHHNSAYGDKSSPPPCKYESEDRVPTWVLNENRVSLVSPHDHTRGLILGLAMTSAFPLTIILGKTLGRVLPKRHPNQ